MSDGPSSGSGSGAGSKPSRTGRPKTPGDWARYFRLLIEPVLSTVDARVAFDHAISRPMSLEAPLIAHAAAVSLAEDFRIPPRAIEDPNRTPDVYLWWSLIDDRLDPLRVIDVRAEGALVAPDVCTTIEVWTEIELAALHALSRQARRLRRDDLDRRLHRAITWHIEHTQPDNATAHAWAAHAFLLEGSPEGSHFAETLVSNCLVRNARPDPMSAWILLDSARALEAESSKP